MSQWSEQVLASFGVKTFPELWELPIEDVIAKLDDASPPADDLCVAGELLASRPAGSNCAIKGKIYEAVPEV